MANLDEQLRYFINVKLTTDPLWHGVDIHLSGHLVGMIYLFQSLNSLVVFFCYVDTRRRRT